MKLVKECKSHLLCEQRQELTALSELMVSALFCKNISSEEKTKKHRSA